MKKYGKWVGILVIILLAAVAAVRFTNGKDVSENKKVSNGIIKFTDKEPGKEIDGYQGVWKNKYGYLYVYRATERYIWFTYNNRHSFAEYVRAEKKDDGRYYFHFETNKIEICFPTLKGNESYLELKDGSIIECSHYDKWNETETSKYTFEEKKTAELFQVKPLDILAYLDNYQKAFAYQEDNNLACVKFGKDRDSERVSFCLLNSYQIAEMFHEHVLDYRFGNIDFTSTKKECDKAWGQPVKITKQKHGYKCVYKYKDYEIDVFFTKAGSIYDIALYLKSKKAALEKYVDGDFEMQGCRIVKYLNTDSRTKEISFPEGAVAIGDNAFNGSKGTLQIKIPKDINLEPQAFTWIGKANITFEEGREEISRWAFVSAGKNDAMVNITLPKSIRVIKTGAFYNLASYGVNLKLNEGLEEIQKQGIYGLAVKFPDSLKKLGSEAIGWRISETGEQELPLELPPNLEEMGDRCIVFEDDRCGEGEDEEPTVKIPASVKKMGENVVVGGSYE